MKFKIDLSQIKSSRVMHDKIRSNIKYKKIVAIIRIKRGQVKFLNKKHNVPRAGYANEGFY